MAGAQLILTAGPTVHVDRDRDWDWWLERDEHGVTACSGRGAIAHAEVREDDDRVRLDFSIDERLPHELHRSLTSMVFEHPALHPRRLVSAAFPHRETDVLLEVRSHVVAISTRVAGTTCLLDGRVN
jgi:hypothetical protein